MDWGEHDRQNPQIVLTQRHILWHTGARHRVLLCAFFVCLSSSCSSDPKDIAFFDRQNPPVQELTNAQVVRSSYGVRQMQLQAPRVQKYEKPEPKTIYPDGVDLQFYNQGRTVRTRLRANYAISFDEQNILQARDSVVVYDYESGDTIYLQDIVWRQADSIFFSNHPVRAVNGNRITIGDGFVSDERMQHLQITRQRGVIEFQE